MPIYQYRCSDCGKISEELYDNYSDSDDSVNCPCGGDAKRIISLCGFKVWHYDDFGDAEARAKKCGVPI